MAMLMLAAYAALAQSPGATSTCSPTLVNVQADQSISFYCDSGRAELRQFAQEITDLRRSLRLNEAQVTALLKALNRLLPSFLDQLQRIEVKQDQSLAGIAMLLRETVTAQSSPDDIEVTVSAQKGKLLAGSELSKCGCWGKPSFFEDKTELYGRTRSNPKCLSGSEEDVACIMDKGSNVCRGVWMIGGAYAPWMRVCQ